jgi:hypothetical protein
MADTRPGDAGGQRLKRYWLTEGLAKWADKPEPWTALRDELAKYVNPEMAKRLATVIFHEHFGFYPGADLNRVMHGKPPRGKVVGPG